MNFECKGKSSWPELVGVEGKVAAETIERENPIVSAHFLLEGSIVFLDRYCRRVYVWVDTNGIVVDVPTIG
ncbi:hypothetical protein WN944_026667 [Citrus x changshan-huyou]|uniref:Uncharacterized protein n=1 Tax=Citrus x changshan-huyou TaxID=2935761 RepID=A0AAP0QE42_9ROSI